MKELYSLTEHNYVVDSGKIDYLHWVIRSTGDHPCAYVGSSGLFGMVSMDELDDILPTHGGITYSGNYPIDGLDPNLDWIGWDYGHAEDYQAFFEKYPEDNNKNIKNSKKYTYKDIMKDIDWVISYLKAIPFIEAENYE